MHLSRTLAAALLGSLVVISSANARCANELQSHGLERRDTIRNPETPKVVVPPSNVNVSVVWHQVTNGTHGSYPRSSVCDSIELLNEAYRPVNFSFHLSELNVVQNATWFREATYNRIGSPAQEMKRATRKGDKRTLNIWTVDFPGTFTGFSTFPFDLDDARPTTLLLDGAIFDWKRLPGVNVPRAPGNGPLIVVHEVGHWFGLDHPFIGGCSSVINDHVADTPPSGRPKGFNTTDCALQETCPGQGPDATWNNYMSYNTDNCLGHFTPGQIKRMHFFATAFRGWT